MHDAWTDKLSDYLDDELSPDERSGARRAPRDLRRLRGALDELKQVVETRRR